MILVEYTERGSVVESDKTGCAPELSVTGSSVANGSGAGVKEAFVERNKKRENTPKRGMTKSQEPMMQFWIPVGIFILAPLLTLLFLWALELFFVESFPNYGVFEGLIRFWVALRRVLQRSDMIFLVFSLALTVILEGITAKGKAASKFIMAVEGVLGLLALVIYILEEAYTKLMDSFSGVVPEYLTANIVMDNRVLFHLFFLISAVFFAILGYYMRAKKMGIGDIVRSFCVRCCKKKKQKGEREV